MKPDQPLPSSGIFFSFLFLKHFLSSYSPRLLSFFLSPLPSPPPPSFPFLLSFFLLLSPLFFPSSPSLSPFDPYFPYLFSSSLASPVLSLTSSPQLTSLHVSTFKDARKPRMLLCTCIPAHRRTFSNTYTNVHRRRVHKSLYRQTSEHIFT